jgi:HPt (histidine-containing phosphotransfer) domain-containing protein
LLPSSPSTRRCIDRKAWDLLLELQEEGEPDVLATLFGIYLKESPEQLAQLRKAVEEADAPAAHVAAHTMKSGSAYLGAVALAGLLQELESATSSGVFEEHVARAANLLLGRIAAEHRDVLAELSEELNSRAPN